MVMNSLTAADLLKLASKNSAGVLPSGFVAVPDSILSEFKTNNDGLRIDYRAYFNAATNELVISGAAKPVLVGKLFADAGKAKDAGIFYDAGRDHATGRFTEKPVPVDQTEGLVKFLLSDAASNYKGATVSFSGEGSAALAFSMASYNLRNDTDAPFSIGTTITSNSWKANWTEDGTLDPQVVDVQVSGALTRDPWAAFDSVGSSATAVVVNPDVESIHLYAAGKTGAVLSSEALNFLTSNVGVYAGEKAASELLGKLVGWGLGKAVAKAEKVSTDALERLLEDRESVEAVSDFLGWRAEVAPADLLQIVRDNISEGQWNVMRGLSPSGYAVDETATIMSVEAALPSATGQMLSGATQTVVWKDAASGAIFETRTAGTLIDGVFEPAPGSSYSIGMDRAGRPVYTGEIANGLLRDSLPAGMQIAGPVHTVSVGVDADGRQTLEFKESHGGTIYVLPDQDGSSKIVATNHLHTTVYSLAADKSITDKASYDADGVPVMSGIPDGLPATVVWGKRPVAGEVAEVGGRLYVANADGDYVRHLGMGQTDLVDPATGQRYLADANGQRTEVGPGQSIGVNSDTGAAVVGVVPEFSLPVPGEAFSQPELPSGMDLAADQYAANNAALQAQLNNTTLNLSAHQQTTLSQQLAQLGLGDVDLYEQSGGTITVSNSDGTVIGSVDKRRDGSVRYVDSKNNGFEIDANGRSQPVAAGLVPAELLDRQQAQQVQAGFGAVQSALSFIQALEHGNTLAAGVAGVAMVNQMLVASGSLPKELQGFSESMRGIGAGLGTVAAAINLADAWQAGDAMGIVQSSASLGAHGINLYAVMNGQKLFDASGAATGAMGQVAQGLGVVGAGLGLVMAIQSGNPLSMASSMLSLLSTLGCIGPWGAVAAIVIALVSSLFESDAPMLEGQARAEWDANGNTRVVTTQDEEGGGATATHWMRNLVEGLQAQLDGMRDADGQPLYGLIAGRLPALGYQYDPDGLHLAKGVSGHLYLKWFDQNGQLQTRYYDGAGSRGDDSGDSLISDFMQHAMRAVVPAWEMETVRQHYVREMAAAAAAEALPGWGLLRQQHVPQETAATALPAAGAGMPVADAARLTQSFTALSFTMAADTVALTAAENARIYVDIDDDGYLEQTDWVAANQALLVIDVNGDGRIGAGELLNLDPAATLARNSLRWLDANEDGVVDARDPAFGVLKVWLDVNHDGVGAVGTELQSLTAAGIAAVDFSSNPPRIVRTDGSAQVLTVERLTGAVKGVAFLMTPGGLLESAEGGETVLHAINTREFDHMAAHTHGGDVDSDGSGEVPVVIGEGDPKLTSTTRHTVTGSSRRSDATLAANDVLGAAGSAGTPISGQGPQQAAMNTGSDQVRSMRSAPLAFVAHGAANAGQGWRQATQEMIRNADHGLFGLGAGTTPLVALGIAAAAVQWPSLVSAASVTPFAESSTDGAVVVSTPDARAGQIDMMVTSTGATAATVGDAGVDAVTAPLDVLYQATAVSSAATVASLLAPMPAVMSMLPDMAAAAATPALASPLASGTAASLPAVPADVVLAYPTVVGELIAGIEDKGLRLSEAMLLENDASMNAPAFPDQQMLRIVAVSDPVHGQVALRRNAAGATEVVFMPDAHYHGPASFSYTVSDQYGLSRSALATIMLAAVNDAPLVGDDAAAGNEDTTLMFHAADLLANDHDVDSAVDGDVLRITRVGQAQHGLALLDSDGVVRFIPDLDYNGPAQFTYWVADRDAGQLAPDDGVGDAGATDVVGHEVAGTMQLTIIAVNDLPVVLGEQLDSDEDIVLEIDPALLLANDSDVDSLTNDQVLRITAVSNARHGAVQLQANGSILFTPDANYVGAAAFSYIVDDGNGGLVTGTTVVNLAAVNDAPQVTGETVRFDEDQLQTIDQALLLANDTDVDNPHAALHIIAVDNATHGAVTLDVDGAIRFTPDADYFGTAAFTYTVADGAGGVTIGTAQLAIMPVNDAPRVRGEAVSTEEDHILHFSIGALLANDIDVDNAHGELQIVGVDAASHGSVRLEHGEIVFTPELNYFGPASFIYTVDDGVGGQSQAQVSLTFNSVNDAPVVNHELLMGKRDVSYTLTQAALLANDTDVEDPAGLVIVGVQHPQHGTVTLNPDGTVTFVPETGYDGRGSFDYLVRDPDGAVVVGQTEIDYTRVNLNPLAVDDSFTGFEDTAFLITAAQLMVNDNDPDPSSFSTLTIAAVANASHGTVTLEADGNVRFMPAPNFYGTATFQYQLADNEGGNTWATAYLHVQSVNDAPIIEDVWYGRPIYGYQWAPAHIIDEYGSPTAGRWELVAVTAEATAITLGTYPYGQVSSPVIGVVSNPLMDANGRAIGLHFYQNGHLRPVGFNTIDSAFSDENGTYYFDDPYRQNGKIIAYDPDGDSAALAFSVASGPQHGHAWANQYTRLDTQTGQDHTLASTVATAETAAWQYYSHRGDPYTGTDPFTMRVTDNGGAATAVMIQTAHRGSRAGGGGKCPVVVDLDGDGIELVQPENSHIFADLNGDGWRERIGWAAIDDGLLAYDANQDGHITQHDEISFVGYKEGAQTDLDGLAAFDTDGDGKLTADDAQWSRFGIVRDLNRNGVQDAGEFITLDHMGISAIGLTRGGSPHLDHGNVVFGTTTVDWTDGRHTDAGDVMFAGEFSRIPDAAQAALQAASATASGAPVNESLMSAPAAEAQLAPANIELDDLARIRQMALVFNQAVTTFLTTTDPPLGYIPLVAPDSGDLINSAFAVMDYDAAQQKTLNVA